MKTLPSYSGRVFVLGENRSVSVRTPDRGSGHMPHSRNHAGPLKPKPQREECLLAKLKPDCVVQVDGVLCLLGVAAVHVDWLGHGAEVNTVISG